MMKKLTKLMALTFMLLMAFSMNAFAAGWTAGQGENSGRWWYDLENGSYYAGNEAGPMWQWLDGNQDGTAECYAFDAEGWMYADTRTPDGYEVNGDGAWTVNGAVQTQTVSAADDTTGEEDVLVVYFSRTNTTERAANLIHQQMGGDMFELQPAESYPSSYSQTTERAQREISEGALPALQAVPENLDAYEIVFVGYPIWWDTTPPVVNTFLSSSDFTGKTVIPFCTSGGSGINGSMSMIRQYCDGANILSGRDLTGASADSIHDWLAGLGLL